MSWRHCFILVLWALPCIAQMQVPASQTSGTAKAASPASAAPPAPQAEKKTPRKVWTNDDVGSIKGGISVVGNPAPSKSDLGGKKSADSGASHDVRSRQIAHYRNQIQQLQSQMEAINTRIVQLRNFKGENTGPSAGIDINQDYNMVPLGDQVIQLEEKKKELQTKIEDLEDDARKDGINPGDLR